MAFTAPLEPKTVFLAEQSKEELIEEILRLWREKEALKKENEALQRKLETLQKRTQPDFAKIRVYQKQKRRKQLGRPIGHVGCTCPNPAQ